MKRDNLRILSILPVLGDPGDARRIAMLQESGFTVEVAAFEREHHRGRLPDCRIENLGRIDHGRYLRRILKLLAALPALRRAIRRHHLVYAEGPDMAYIAIIAGLGLGRPVVLEVGDIREVQTAAGFRGRLVRAIDGFFINRCFLLVTTSQNFIDGYYRRCLHSPITAMVIENKLEPAPAGGVELAGSDETPPGKPLVDRPLRIGYFGVLRCAWSWNVLERLARARPRDVEIVLAGYPLNIPDLPARAAALLNVEFLGEFKSPDDLPSLYGRIDLAWGCYPRPAPGDWNWRWARTYRFYESCFFRRPIIALAGSGDAPEVERLGIGLTVPGVEEQAVDRILAITPEDLSRWRLNLARLDRGVYEYTTETEELKGAITRCLGGKIRPGAVMPARDQERERR